MITQRRLRDLLSYDPETGIFRWRVSRGKAKSGAVAGSINKSTGYRIIMLFGRRYKAHRLAWFYMKGEWPVDKIDHRNTIRNDNRFKNLREATAAGNQHNSGRRRNNRSGYKGVDFKAGCGKWRAAITVNSRQMHLGYFTDIDAAAAAYAAAAAQYHGEFARIE
jgi:hypothetical protein